MEKEKLTLEETQLKVERVLEGVYAVTWFGPVTQLIQGAVFFGNKAEVNAEFYKEKVIEEWVENDYLNEEGEVEMEYPETEEEEEEGC